LLIQFNIGWAWLGNGSGYCNSNLQELDIVNSSPSDGRSWTSTTYTSWGNALIYYTGYGIRDTGVKATHF
jgi:hypothetical protein